MVINTRPTTCQGAENKSAQNHRIPSPHQKTCQTLSSQAKVLCRKGQQIVQECVGVDDYKQIVSQRTAAVAV